jgi:hypothetical protein
MKIIHYKLAPRKFAKNPTAAAKSDRLFQLLASE